MKRAWAGPANMGRNMVLFAKFLKYLYLLNYELESVPNAGFIKYSRCAIRQKNLGKTRSIEDDIGCFL